MGYSLWKFVILALAASSQQTTPARPNIANQTFEVDVVFPGPVGQTYDMREIQTFKANEIIPLVLAVQNLTDWTVGNLSIRWQWFIYSIAPPDYQPIDWLDGGWLETVDATKTDPAFLVAVANSSEWYRNDTGVHVTPKAPGDIYMFQWTAFFDWDDSRCAFRHRRGELPNVNALQAPYRGGFHAGAVFDVLSESEQLRANFSTAVVAIPQAPQCPETSGLYHVHGTSNATETECPVDITVINPGTTIPEGTNEGNPCAVQIDNAMASSISSRVASVTSAWTAHSTTTTRSVPTSTSRGGAGPALPVQTAIAAAACLLCGLTLS